MKVSLKAARVNANLTMDEAAQKVGINEATLRKWEKGSTSPTVDRFRKLCEVYGCTTEDIFFPYE